MSQTEPDSIQFRPNETVTPDRLNEIQSRQEEQARTYAENSGHPPTTPPVRVSGDGRFNSPPLVEHFLGRVRTTAPSDSGVSSDFTDARYFVDFAVPYESLKLNEQLRDRVETAPGIKGWVVATSLSELPAPDSTDTRAAGTHSLTAGTLVHVFAWRTRNTTPQTGVPQWAFVSGGGGGTLTVGQFVGQSFVSLDGVGVWMLRSYIPKLP